MAVVTFDKPNQIKHVTLGAAGVQTEVQFHKDSRACVVGFYAPGDFTTTAAGQVAFTGADGGALGTNKWQPVHANSEWPFILRDAESADAIRTVYLSSLTASASVVVVSLEAAQ